MSRRLVDFRGVWGVVRLCLTPNYVVPFDLKEPILAATISLLTNYVCSGRATPVKDADKSIPLSARAGCAVVPFVGVCPEVVKVVEEAVRRAGGDVCSALLASVEYCGRYEPSSRVFCNAIVLAAFASAFSTPSDIAFEVYSEEYRVGEEG